MRQMVKDYTIICIHSMNGKQVTLHIPADSFDNAVYYAQIQLGDEWYVVSVEETDE